MIDYDYIYAFGEKRENIEIDEPINIAIKLCALVTFFNCFVIAILKITM